MRHCRQCDMGGTQQQGGVESWDSVGPGLTFFNISTCPAVLLCNQNSLNVPILLLKIISEEKREKMSKFFPFATYTIVRFTTGSVLRGYKGRQIYSATRDPSPVGWSARRSPFYNPLDTFGVLLPAFSIPITGHVFFVENTITDSEK